MLETRLILASAEERWGEVTRRHPELADAVELQRRLVQRTVELAEEVRACPPLQHHLSGETTVARLRAGRPFLLGEPISVDGGRLAPFVTGFCRDLATGAAGDPAERLRGTLERGEIDIGSLVAASLTRRQEAIRAKAHHVGVSPDLLWLVAELSAAPLANHLQAALWPDPSEPDSAVTSWDEGYCPACGSRPALSEQIAGVVDPRWLRCSFCGSAWPMPAGRCAYCATTGDAFVTAGLDTVSARYRVEMCGGCGGYLKVVDVDVTTPFAQLAVEDLASTGLDLGASEKGYARPPMPELPEADDAPCPPPHPADTR